MRPAWPQCWDRFAESRTQPPAALRCPRRDRRPQQFWPDLLCWPRRSDDGGSPCRRQQGQCATAGSWVLASDHRRKSAGAALIVNNTRTFTLDRHKIAVEYQTLTIIPRAPLVRSARRQGITRWLMTDFAR